MKRLQLSVLAILVAVSSLVPCEKGMANELTVGAIPCAKVNPMIAGMIYEQWPAGSRPPVTVIKNAKMEHGLASLRAHIPPGHYYVQINGSSSCSFQGPLSLLPGEDRAILVQLEKNYGVFDCYPYALAGRLPLEGVAAVDLVRHIAGKEFLWHGLLINTAFHFECIPPAKWMLRVKLQSGDIDLPGEIDFTGHNLYQIRNVTVDELLHHAP